MDEQLNDWLSTWGLLVANITFSVGAQQFQDFPREEEAGYNRKSKVRKSGTPREKSRPSECGQQPHLVPCTMPSVDACIPAHAEGDVWLNPGPVFKSKA